MCRSVGLFLPELPTITSNVERFSVVRPYMIEETIQLIKPMCHQHMETILMMKPRDKLTRRCVQIFPCTGLFEMIWERGEHPWHCR